MPQRHWHAHGFRPWQQLTLDNRMVTTPICHRSTAASYQILLEVIQRYVCHAWFLRYLSIRWIIGRILISCITKVEYEVDSSFWNDNYRYYFWMFFLVPYWTKFQRKIFSANKIFGGNSDIILICLGAGYILNYSRQNISADKIFVIVQDFRHFCPYHRYFLRWGSSTFPRNIVVELYTLFFIRTWFIRKYY